MLGSFGGGYVRVSRWKEMNENFEINEKFEKGLLV